MCDEFTVADNNKALRSGLTRRQFGLATAGVAATMMLPLSANAQDVREADVVIPTPDGEADCYLVHPASGKHPAVIIWPDALGLRPAFRAMGKRLALAGYTVLVVNPFYRQAKAPVVPEGASFQDESVRSRIIPLMRSLTPETNVTDAKAFVAYVDQLDSVDTSRKIGTMGYCMGGAIVMRTAATEPERIGAGASFHGGGLVTDAENSPHRLIPGMKADFLVAIAENDHEKEPHAEGVLKESFEKAGLKAEVEVYEGALHGWCVPDSAVYNEAQAERAWSRLLALFDSALSSSAG